MKNKLLYFALILVFTSCGLDDSNKEQTESSEVKETEMQFPGLQEKAKSIFGQLPQVAENPDNVITKEKLILGKKLYFDNRLSKDNTQSCNTCHNVATYGVDNSPLSKGNDGGFGTRNSPTTYNAALHSTQFWDGREPDVEAQSGGPILNPAEMAMPSEKAVVKRLKGIEEYVTLFATAFPDDKKPISYDNIKKAIGAYERTFITPSKFDDYLAGNEKALNQQEKEGLQSFINVGCITCHSSNVLGGHLFQKFGLMQNYWELTKSEVIDNGRYDVTKNEADKYIFKVPSLRNIEKTYPYFHDGSIQDLGEATIIMAKLQLNKDLTDKEVNDMLVFMNTLTADIPEDIK